MALTGLFVTLVGIRLLRKPVAASPDAGATVAAPEPATAPAYSARGTSEPQTGRPRPSTPLLLAVGAGVGLLSGLLANGGGFLLVPAYLLLFRMEARQAAATSLVAVALLALPGTFVHWRLGHIDPVLALQLAAGVIPSTYLGARLGVELEGRQSRLLFGWFLLLFGLFFLGRTLYRAEVSGWYD
jgi:uncharacterized membrane protein YfcA